jgi:hypothetical protein
MAARKVKVRPAQRQEQLAQQRSEREVHLQHAVNLMTSGAFERGRTTYELAKEWGRSDDYAERVSAEASRIVTGAIKVDEGSRARLLATLDHALAMAMEQKNLRSVTEIGRLLAQIEGHEAPKKVEGVFSLASALASVEDDSE